MNRCTKHLPNTSKDVFKISTTDVFKTSTPLSYKISYRYLWKHLEDIWNIWKKYLEDIFKIYIAVWVAASENPLSLFWIILVRENSFLLFPSFFSPLSFKSYTLLKVYALKVMEVLIKNIFRWFRKRKFDKVVKISPCQELINAFRLPLIFEHCPWFLSTIYLERKRSFLRYCFCGQSYS